MKIAKTAARRKAPPTISANSSFADSYVVSYLSRRFRLRRLAALVIAEACGLGARQ